MYPGKLKGELVAQGFKPNETETIYRHQVNGSNYGVDFNKEEIFRFEDGERITEDPSDFFLCSLHALLNRLQPAESTCPGKEVAVKEVKEIPAQMSEKQISDITMSDIRDYICPLATEQEAYMFLKLCQARNLNPFTKEAYLIKYSPNKEASTVVGKDAFTRRAEEHPDFAGFEAGIIVKNTEGTIERRPGTFYLPDETILGGWSKVYRTSCRVPFENEVSYAEYEGHRKDGSVTQFWATKPATMIRKVALVQSLREAFPSDLGGCYDQSEVEMIE